jgi:D-glycero-alpha-D-manno-heptose-7-phosphate kinase
MKVRSKAPLRLGLAGGGTDVSPYCDDHGGAVLNITIDMFARCTISDDVSEIIFISEDYDCKEVSKVGLQETKGELILHKAVYNKIFTKYLDSKFIPLKVVTHCDAPPGSGLGSSSTLVVSMIKAYEMFFNFSLNEYELADLAFEIERIDCGLGGGFQDQYSAAFGGVNFIEFSKNRKSIVHRLRIKDSTLYELEESIILFFTGISRSSEKIINHQKSAIQDKDKLNALHDVKKYAKKIKDSLLISDLESFFDYQKESWAAKKATSKYISTDYIDDINNELIKFGVKGIKISGAGGGGFMMVYVDPSHRLATSNFLKKYDGRVYNFHFTLEGATAWKV